MPKDFSLPLAEHIDVAVTHQRVHTELDKVGAYVEGDLWLERSMSMSFEEVIRT
ncbi:hypothetical protein HCZ30_16255 [Marivivens donghaensis]|uniref:Uncharacterized protein n=1 Tax=Marivivens donghaensis TaxID=1699413 RepID=A0ABX0W1W1_9RHOB|nr:hypothetical protein [Marivivens donghaensis]NIY73980.1 hypothetical protein [Marivivens donghaensis]